MKTDTDKAADQQGENYGTDNITFRINRDKYAVVQNVCRTLGIRIIDVARKDYSQKLGTLAQIQDLPERQKYDYLEFPAEMLIFSEMNSDQVDAFLAEYKKGGCGTNCTKSCNHRQ